MFERHVHAYSGERFHFLFTVRRRMFGPSLNLTCKSGLSPCIQLVLSDSSPLGKEENLQKKGKENE